MTNTIKTSTQIKTISAWALWPLGLATALSLMGDVTLYAVLPTHSADAGIALAMVGVILSINRIIRLLTNSAAGWLFDRLPYRREIFLGSLALGVFTTTLYALSAGLPTLLVGRLLWGIAWSGIWVGGNALVLEIAPEAQRGHWVGIYQMWFFFGSATASFIGGTLTDLVGYRGALWIGASISAAGALAALLALTARQSEPRADSARAPLVFSRGAVWSSVRAISPAMWATATAQGVNRLAAAGIVSATLGLVVQQSFGAGVPWGAWQIGVASLSGTLLGARTLISIAGAPFAGKLSDDAGQRWSWLTLSMIAGALGTAVLPASNISILLIGTVISALAYGGIQAVTTGLVGDLSDKKEYGKNIGIYQTAGDLGSAIGPLVAYALLPITGLFAIYSGTALVMLATAGWAWQFARGRKNAPTP